MKHIKNKYNLQKRKKKKEEKKKKHTHTYSRTHMAHGRGAIKYTYNKAIHTGMCVLSSQGRDFRHTHKKKKNLPPNYPASKS